MTDVSCTVSSCYYWGRGNKCEASEILVKNNLKTSPYADAGQIGQPGKARTSAETICETFRPRNES